MMTRRKNNYVLIGLAILLIVVVNYATFLSKPAPAPDISFKTISNKTIKLKELQGKVVLITFWASNCQSCLKEVPHFKSLYQDYHQNGLEIIAIAMYYDRPNFVVDTVKAYQIPYDIVLDLDMQLATALGDISLTPTTLLINPEGEIVFQTTGLFDLIAMQKRIESALGSRL